MNDDKQIKKLQKVEDDAYKYDISRDKRNKSLDHKTSEKDLQ